MIRKTFPTAIKEAGRGTFAVTVSTSSPDRDGDTIDPQGWKLESYRHNPIVLWQHDNHLPPIARCTDIQVQGNRLVAKMEFPPAGISPLADEIHGLMEAGFLHSTSVGFRLLRSTPNGIGRNIAEAELMEFSLVNIPSQVEARVQRCAGQGCNELALKHWLGTTHHKEDTMDTTTLLEDRTARQLAALFEDQIEDDTERKTMSTTEDAFDAMLAAMRAAFPLMGTDMTQEELGKRVDASFRTLGPNASIADLCRALMQQGAMAPKFWRNDADVFDVDEKELAAIIGRLVAEEIPRATRSALNSALGRLD